MIANNLTVEISTKDRYDFLAHALHSITQQIVKPRHIIIFDDSINKIDLRKVNFFQRLFEMMRRMEIECYVECTNGRGQVQNHIDALNKCQTEFIHRMDDDNILEPNVFENLLPIIENDKKIGAIGGIILHPDTKFPPEATSPSIKDVLFKYAINFSPFKGLRECQHIYSNFMARVSAIKGCYPNDLSKIGHREESTATYNLLQKGYKLLIHGETFTWHLRAGGGGIRSYNDSKLWYDDDVKFKQRLKEWGVKLNQYFPVVINGGIGDNFAVKLLLPYIRKKCKENNAKIFLSTVYPDCFWDESNLEIVNIETGKVLFDGANSFDVYQLGYKEDGKLSLLNGYRKIYNILNLLPEKQLTINKNSKKIILSLLSRYTHLKKRPSPKNYPYILQLVRLLKQNGFETIQVGTDKEIDYDCTERYDNLKMSELLALLEQSCTFISVDNFFHHFAYYYNRRGVVLWGQSNPNLFGYKEHINLFTDKKYFRKDKDQYGFWEEAPYISESFVEPEDVLISLSQLLV